MAQLRASQKPSKIASVAKGNEIMNICGDPQLIGFPTAIGPIIEYKLLLLGSHKLWLPSKINCREPQVVAPYQNHYEGATIIRATCHKAFQIIFSIPIPFFSRYPSTLNLCYPTCTFFRLIL